VLDPPAALGHEKGDRCATATIPATTTQKTQAWSNTPTLKFIPITPATRAPGRIMTDTSVRIFIT
jgi:hypothetical protein